jgi:hypothetical protein
MVNVWSVVTAAFFTKQKVVVKYVEQVVAMID